MWEWWYWIPIGIVAGFVVYVIIVALSLGRE